MPIRRIAYTLLVLVTTCLTAPGVEADFEQTVKPFLSRYCFQCHGKDAGKGDRRFDILDGRLSNTNDLADMQEILDQLQLGEMPPVDELQPSDQERRKVVAWLQTRIQMFHESRSGAGQRSVLRRLNAREYRNTVRDLLHLNVEMFDPAAGFPKDQSVEHLDNIGDTLVTSGYLLQQYLTAADQVIHKAVFPLDRPEERTWIFTDNFHQQPEIDQVHRRTNKFTHLTLYDVVGADKHEGAYAPIHDFAEGVPFDGRYELQLNAVAVNRQHPYDDDFVGTNQDELLRLGIRPGLKSAGPLHKPQPMEPLLAEIELSDTPGKYTMEVWLDAGYTPRFTFRNGLMDVRNMWGKLVSRYKKQFPERKKGGIVENRFNAIKYGKLPQIQVFDVKVRGPLIDSWPTESQKAVFGDQAEQILTTRKLSETQARRQLVRFMPRAFRRAVEESEIERIVQVIRTRKKQGRSEIEAYCDGLKAVLCSPGFIYLEQNPKTPTASALASRLSYFLWSSMPDDRLLQKVGAFRPDASGDKSEFDQARATELVRYEIDRMLEDPRSDDMVEGFLGSWLTLRDFGSQPPDRSDFPDYYHYDLGTAMKMETTLFTRYLLQENLSVSNFLNSDFTFLNRRLAEHYGLTTPANAEFERVQLADDRRGGLLGQGSVLTVSANGIDTSPVVRGVWLLENLLGTPPSPPPPDIEPLDPDIRGARTIREQLEKHRTVASCNDCHRKIDPMGFALENFNPVGQWRTNYGRKQPIDSSGRLPNGKSYQDIISFKSILLDQQEIFIRALTKKLLAYATGRRMVTTDRLEIDRIVAELRSKGNGLATLVRLVATSDAFMGR